MAWTRVSYGALEYPGCYDNGNGALAYISENPDYPGIERVKIAPYARRRSASTYYRLAEDAAGAHCRLGTHGFATAAEAMQAYRRRVKEC
jgi:hypothetical protein